jgi:hypothetical protein
MQSEIHLTADTLHTLPSTPRFTVKPEHFPTSIGTQLSLMDQARNTYGIRVLSDENQREESMKSIKLTGAALVVLSVLVAPAMAQNARYVRGHSAQSVFCATREPGNPHSKYCDYMAWSKWRQRGSWDSSLDDACFHNPAYVPGECGFNAQGQVLFGAHP